MRIKNQMNIKPLPTNLKEMLSKTPKGIISYMEDGFKEWSFLGWIEIDTREAWFGISLGGNGSWHDAKERPQICTVFGKKKCRKICSEDIEKEQEQIIIENKSSIILFYGSDNTSYMRRMTPEEYEKGNLDIYIREDKDLYYNS